MQRAAAVTEPTLVLPRFIENVDAVAALCGRARRVDRLPDGRTALVVRFSEGGRLDVTIVGPRTHALLKDASGFVSAVSLYFRPAWSAALIGVPAHELTDAFVTLEDLWGPSARVLCAELVAATSVAEVVDRAGRALVSRAERTFQPTSARLARDGVCMLEGDEARVDHVAERLGVTTRHLRRAFMENVGVGPKDFARSVRLQRAIRMARNTGDWARVAADAGYYDQAHLITEFRALVGLTPGAFLRRAREKDPLLAARPNATAAR